MTTCCAPSRFMSASCRCTSMESGVVSEEGSRWSRLPYPSVPSTSQHEASPLSRVIARATKCDTEVFPFVPVTPTTRREREG